MIAKHVWAALAVGLVAHFVSLYLAPRILMRISIERVSEGRFNAWRTSPRITADVRTIIRPSPDFAYAACAFDLSDGPVTVRIAPWSDYWSLSLYADNSDNFFVLDDREARQGASITIARRPPRDLNEGSTYVRSPSTRGIALIRRLAPSLETYNAAATLPQHDVCAAYPD